MENKLSKEEKAENYANETNGFLNEYQRDYENSKRDFLAGYTARDEEDGWVSVDERLPENRRWVIGFQSEDNGFLFNAIQVQYIDGYFYNWKTREMEIHITHWQPLPSKPVEK